MKHLKKFFAVALVGVMVLTALTGCGKSAKTYSSEVVSKLGTNSGVTENEATTKSAEKLVSGVKKLGVTGLYELARNPEKAEETAKKILADAGLSTETNKFSVVASGYGYKVAVGMDGATKETGDASGFFAQQIKDNNADESNKKITKYGIATYSTLGVDIVIMVAEY